MSTEASPLAGVIDVAMLKPLVAHPKIAEVLHVAADSICGRDDVQTAVPTATFGAIKAMLIAIIGGNWDDAKTTAALESAGLSVSASEVATVIAARSAEVRSALIERAPLLFPYSLKDVDWSVRLVVSSDKLGSLKEPTVLVNLELAPVSQSEDADPAAARPRSVAIELNASELDALINTLSGAQAIVQTYNL